VNNLKYMSGFGNEFETEALAGALPVGRNNPQKCPFNLYAEQLSGSPFTAPSASNCRSWLYRIRPSVKHVAKMHRRAVEYWRSAPLPTDAPPEQYRWDPIAFSKEPVNFVTGMRTMTTAGNVRMQSGCAIHAYAFNQSMEDEFLCCADGELMIVPQQGELDIVTEFGCILLIPGEIAVIPRGVIFQVLLHGSDNARGFVCENYGARFSLPERGPIGANGLANSRDFLTPVAAFQDRELAGELWFKWCGGFFSSSINQSPFDVVAWHGNYAPYKYDLRRFSPIGSISFDHPDPSIFTVLTAPTDTPGTANIDFVIFTERWLVAEDTFRPPWFHRNIMSEFMGNLHGVYDAKPQGFVAGGMSLHNMYLPHGPDNNAYEGASNADLEPEKLSDTLSFMFETKLPQQVTPFAVNEAPLQADYATCWDSLERKFTQP